jgi:hypothetical protein
MVCPMCRGARLIAKHRHLDRIQTPYRECDCMSLDIDQASGKPRMSLDGRRQMYRLDEQREIDNILRYRDAQARFDDDDHVPF